MYAQACAGFQPASDEIRRCFPVVATGNWGCGVFKGCADLKAMLQWASASHGGRQLRYFPYNTSGLGARLARLSQAAIDTRATVGQLWAVLRGLSKDAARLAPDRPNFRPGEAVVGLRGSKEGVRGVLVRGGRSSTRWVVRWADTNKRKGYEEADLVRPGADLTRQLPASERAHLENLLADNVAFVDEVIKRLHGL